LDVTKNSKTVAIGAIVAIVVVVFVARDLFLGRQKTVTCPDGSYPTIDIRVFTTQYWAYSANLETSVADKIDPRVLAQLSDALQAASQRSSANTWSLDTTHAPSPHPNTNNWGLLLLSSTGRHSPQRTHSPSLAWGQAIHLP
jgi:hypothetical protein